MKCHLHSKSFILFITFSVVFNVGLVVSDSEADADATADADLLAEHRSAKPEPLLDRIASLFGVGSTEKASKPAPVFQRPQGGLLAQASQQRPVVAVASRPSGSGYGAPPPPVSNYNALPPPPPPPRLPVRSPAPLPQSRPPVYQPQSSASNNFPTFANPDVSAFGGPSLNSDPWQIAQPANMAQIQDLQVQCEKDMMRVRIIFDRPFYGMVFSKGHYSNVNCVHVPAGLGQTQATFDISLQSCGMVSSVNSNDYGASSGPTPQGSFIENTIVVQYDPLLQEVWDQARKLRCTWYDYYEKAVTFKPYQVDMLDPVTANFLGDNLRCWMQIQVGKGPYASEVSGIIKIGQTMTMVLGVKDDENKFDMMVRNCVAHDGRKAPIQLVDQKGCVVRPKIMSPFKKVKNFDATANVLAYAYFQAFKFPDSMNVHFQCVVQVCRGACPDPQCGGVISDIPISSNDNYGAPQAPALDSYGSPLGDPLFSSSSDINPRVPLNKRTNLADEAEAFEDEDEEEEEDDPLQFKKRMGTEPVSLGGRPRSLEPDDALDEKSRSIDVKNIREDSIRNTADASEGKDEIVNNPEPHRRKKRFALDSNGHRILRVVKRDTTEMADVETTEKVIQVLAPNDVQFSLSTEDKEEVVINTNSLNNSLCVDTSAFIGVTVTFLMILIVALITIFFLWMRIRMFDRNKQLL